MANRYMKIYSMSLLIREMQIKAQWDTSSHLSEWLSSVNQHTTSAGEDVEKGGTLLHCWWECRLVQPLWKAVCRYLKKLKMDLPFDSAFPFLGICLKKHKPLIWKNRSTPTFIASLFLIIKTCKQSNCPSEDEWIKHYGTFTQWNTIL